MSRGAKWLLVALLGLLIYIGFTVAIGASEQQTIFPFHRVSGSLWALYAVDDLKLAAVLLVLFAVALLLHPGK